MKGYFLEREKFKSEIRKQISVSLKSGNHQKILKSIAEAVRKMQDSLNEICELCQMGSGIKDGRKLSIIYIAVFLWEYEGPYSFCVDFSCYLLTINGHDLHNFFKRKYALTFEEIGEVDIFTKLNFLAQHNLGFLNREEDRKLRNKIAHHDFSILADGRIMIDGKTTDVISKWADLCKFATETLNIFTECMKTESLS